MHIIIGILILIIFIMGFIINNMMKKYEKQEDILISYMDYLNKISSIIEFSDKKLKEIDSRGSFEADDEIGWFFEQIKNIQNFLNDFQIKKL